MPDPLSNKDIRRLIHQAPKLGRLTSSLDSQYAENPFGVTWGSRKDNRSCRDMTLANPFAEIHVRRLIHPLAPKLFAAQTHYAITGRVEMVAPSNIRASALNTRSHLASHSEFRKAINEIRGSGAKYALKTDLHRFYPSVLPEQLALSLRKLIASSAGFHIAEAILKCEGDTGLSGLPVGPESSAWLANVVLNETDRVFDSFPQVQVVRLSDDHFMADGSPTIVEACFQSLCTKLDTISLSISEPKTLRTWRDGLTVSQLLNRATVSQVDLDIAVKEKDWREIDRKLLEELRRPEPRRARLNRLFKKSIESVQQYNTSRIIDLMLEQPDLWECSCPRAGRYLATFADPEQLERMIYVAIDLATDGYVACEQVVHLTKAAASAMDRFPRHRRGVAARDLLKHARKNDWIPVRGWARCSAFEFDPEMVAGQTIDSGEFEDLHPFEQRWALGFADRQRHSSWLEREKRDGNWPTTAEWRLSSGR